MKIGVKVTEDNRIITIRFIDRTGSSMFDKEDIGPYTDKLMNLGVKIEPSSVLNSGKKTVYKQFNRNNLEMNMKQTYEALNVLKDMEKEVNSRYSTEQIEIELDDYLRGMEG